VEIAPALFKRHQNNRANSGKMMIKSAVRPASGYTKRVTFRGYRDCNIDVKAT
jgi:hypothetical protein